MLNAQGIGRLRDIHDYHMFEFRNDCCESANFLNNFVY